MFLVLALAVGVYLACVVPHFGGIDETAHFYRSYQISTGRLLPLDPADSEFSGACIPDDVVATSSAKASTGSTMVRGSRVANRGEEARVLARHPRVPDRLVTTVRDLL